MISQLKKQQILAMYDLIPDVMFWIKDLDGVFVHANQSFVEHVGAASLNQVVGACDADFSPQALAQQYIADDQKVLQGQAVTDRLEVNLTDNGETAWFTTSKRPLYGQNGQIIGSYGISHHLEKTSVALHGVQVLKQPIELIRSRFSEDLCISEIARSAHLSVSALERRFKKYLSRTPIQYLADVRLENARRALIESNLAIADVAFESGFADASYFSRRFKRKFGVLPSEFRNQYKR